MGLTKSWEGLGGTENKTKENNGAITHMMYHRSLFPMWPLPNMEHVWRPHFTYTGTRPPRGPMVYCVDEQLIRLGIYSFSNHIFYNCIDVKRRLMCNFGNVDDGSVSTN